MANIAAAPPPPVAGKKRVEGKTSEMEEGQEGDQRKEMEWIRTPLGTSDDGVEVFVVEVNDVGCEGEGGKDECGEGTSEPHGGQEFRKRVGECMLLARGTTWLWPVCSCRQVIHDSASTQFRALRNTWCP